MNRLPLPVLLTMVVLGLASCKDMPDYFGRNTGAKVATTMLPEAATPLSKSALAARPASETMDAAAQPRPPEQAIFRGTGSFVNAQAPSQGTGAIGPEGDVTLNFVNADVRDVLKEVLGDLLKLNYVVGANVQGAVTIQTSEPLGRAKVLPALEEALRLNGIAMVRADNVLKIVPIAEAARQSDMVRPSAARAGAGFRVQLVPLKYVSAADMQRVLEPLAPPSSVLRADPTRNVLILGGTAGELTTMLDNIHTFDVNWLAGMSFGLFPLKVASAKTLAGELDQIVGGKDSPIAGLVRLVPIERMNAILAISSRPEYLDQLRDWVDRLDRANATAERRIYVYYVQNGRAADLAAVLIRVLTSRGGGGGAAQATKADTVSPGGLTQSGYAMASPAATPLTRSPQVAPTPPPAQSPGAAPLSLGSEPATAAGAAGTQTIRITADETNNAVVIYATAREYAVVEDALRRLDIVPRQVLLEAAIAEVTLTNQLRYGVQTFLQTRGGHNQIIRTDTNTSVITPPLPGFAYLFSSGNDIKVILSALESVTHVNVISSPELFVLNNQTATLQVGDQVPIATQSAVSVQNPDAPVVNSIEFRDTGVILKVTPRVNDGGLVLLDISQEVSDVTQTTTSTLNSPTIQQRKISSTVAIQDGQTIALGGLIKDSKDGGRSGVPVLQHIPILGPLFSTTTDNSTRTELLVLITPHVVDSQQRAREVTDELRRKLPAIRAVFERAQ